MIPDPIKYSMKRCRLQICTSMRLYAYDISTIGLGGEEEVIGWFLGYPSVTATEGGENEIPFSYQ